MTNSISSQPSPFPAALIKSVSTSEGGVQNPSTNQPSSSGTTPGLKKSKKSILGPRLTGLFKKTKKASAEDDHVTTAPSPKEKSSYGARLRAKFEDLKHGSSTKNKGKSREKVPDNSGLDKPLPDLPQDKGKSREVTDDSGRNKPLPDLPKDPGDIPGPQTSGVPLPSKSDKASGPQTERSFLDKNLPDAGDGSRAGPSASPIISTPDDPWGLKEPQNVTPGPFLRTTSTMQLDVAGPSDAPETTTIALDVAGPSDAPPTTTAKGKEVATKKEPITLPEDVIRDAEKELQKLHELRRSLLEQSKNVPSPASDSEQALATVKEKIIEKTFFLEGAVARFLANTTPLNTEPGTLPDQVAKFIKENRESGAGDSATVGAYKRLYDVAPNGRPWKEGPEEKLSLAKIPGNKLMQDAGSGSIIEFPELTSMESERARLTGEIDRVRMTYDAWEKALDRVGPPAPEPDSTIRDTIWRPTSEETTLFDNVKASRELLVDTMNKIVSDILAMAHDGARDAGLPPLALTPTSSLKEIKDALMAAQITVKSNQKGKPHESFQQLLDAIEHPLVLARYAHEAINYANGQGRFPIPLRNSSKRAPGLSAQTMRQAAPTDKTTHAPGDAKVSSDPSPKPAEQPSTQEAAPTFESIADADNELRRLLASRTTAISSAHLRNRNTATAGPSGPNVDSAESESEESTAQIELKILETSFFIEGEAVLEVKIRNPDPETGSMYEKVANFVAANSKPGSTTGCAYKRLFDVAPNGRPWNERPGQMLALEKTTGDHLAQEVLSGNSLTLPTLTPTEEKRARLTGEINRARMTYAAWKVTYDELTQNPTKNPTLNPTPHNKRMFANVEASRELLVDTMNKIVQDILAMAKTGTTDAHVSALQPTASLEDIEKALVQAQETVVSNNKRNPHESFPAELAPIEHPLAMVRYAHEAMKDLTDEKTRELVKSTHTLQALSAGGHLRTLAGTAIPDAICAMLHALIANLFARAVTKNPNLIMLMTMLGLGVAIGPVNQTVGPFLRWIFARFMGLHILAKKKGKEAYGDASPFTISKTTGRPQELSEDQLANDQKQVQVKRANWDQLASRYTYAGLPGALSGMAAYGVGYGIKGYMGWGSLAAPVITTLLSQLTASFFMVNQRAFQQHEGEYLFKLEKDTNVLLKQVWDGLATLDPRKFENLRKFFNSVYSGVGGIGAATLVSKGSALVANDHLGNVSPTHESINGAVQLVILILIVLSGTEHDPEMELERAIMAGVGIDPKDKNAGARWASHQANPWNWAKKYLPFHTQKEGWFGRGVATVFGGPTALSGFIIDNTSILTSNIILAVAGILKEQAMAVRGKGADKISAGTPVRFNAPQFASQRLIVASTPPVAPV